MEFCTPEKTGIHSENILEYIKILEQSRLATHNVLIMRGGKLLYEAYWKPFDVDFKHRMYSVTKSFVEQVRGVDCSGVIASLYDKGLIEEKGRLELPGKPLIYGTTDTFLRCFSLNSLDALPPLPEKDENQETADEITDDAVSSEND